MIVRNYCQSPYAGARLTNVPISFTLAFVYLGGRVRATDAFFGMGAACLAALFATLCFLSAGGAAQLLRSETEIVPAATGREAKNLSNVFGYCKNGLGCACVSRAD
jgi:hypothetical protein